MSGVAKKLMGAAGAGGGGFTAIEDVFSTYLYTGNGSTQTITNGIDLAGEGGLVWIKARTNSTVNHSLFDTERGAYNLLRSNLTEANFSFDPFTLSEFLSDGFTVSDTSDGGYGVNGPAGGFYSGNGTYASWTFRKAPRFFDVVTYTGTGAARTVDHNLGTTVGSIIIKRTDTTSNWAVYHRGNTVAPETDFLSLNLTNATADDATYWNDTAPTDSVFTVGTNAAVNASGGTYVAYLFAHDPLGPSEDGSDGLIACGSFSGLGAVDYNGTEVVLGWEPQWVLMKAANTTSDWYIFDMMRGTPVDYSGAQAFSPQLEPNTSDAEGSIAPSAVAPTPTGFKVNNAFFADNSKTFIYIAIRRGPMRVPESGTEVFAISDRDSTPPLLKSGFPVDFGIYFSNITSTRNNVASARLAQGKYLLTNSTQAELADASQQFDFNDGYFDAALPASTTALSYMFRRAPNFFDVVAYTGNSVVGRTVPHNLGVAPEMMIVKARNNASASWSVYAAPLGNTKYLRLNSTNAAGTSSSFWNNTTPTDTVFTLGVDGDVNNSGFTYIAYLFATLAGVSKVGSYTGNGSSQTIDCGFTTGARLVLIKATSTTGDWLIADTARGIVAGNDPYLELNTTNAEVTSEDWLDPDSSGFIVNEVAGSNANTSGVSYIFYAIA